MDRATRLDEVRTKTESLYQSLESCVKTLNEILFIGDGTLLRSSLQFRGSWISKVCKSEWYEYLESQKASKEEWEKKDIAKRGKWRKKKDFDSHSELGEPLLAFFLEMRTQNEKLLAELRSIAGNPDHALARVSDVADIASRISTRAHFGHIFPLFLEGYLKEKNDSKIIEEFSGPIKEMRTIAEELAQISKPFQSSGFPIEHVSLNYWTVNKLSGASANTASSGKSVDAKFSKFWGKEEWALTKACEAAFPNWRNMSCKTLYDEMKLYKASQKSAFLELAQKEVGYEKLGEKFDYVDNRGVSHPQYRISLFANVKENRYL